MPRRITPFGEAPLICGSDLFEPEDPEALCRHLESDLEVLREAGASPETVDRTVFRNALHWPGIGAR